MSQEWNNGIIRVEGVVGQGVDRRIDHRIEERAVGVVGAGVEAGERIELSCGSKTI